MRRASAPAAWRHRRHGPHAMAAAPLMSLGMILLLSVSARAQQPFPHAEHEGMFPLCAGCHAGIASGDAAELYPQPALCARCHDGAEEPVVTWTPPPPAEPGLRFTHPEHAAAAEARGSVAGCTDCHVLEGQRRMDVRLAVAGRCFDCHEGAHFTTTECSTCHRAAPPGAHTVAVHEGCGAAGCHEAMPAAGVPADTRAFCTSCHAGLEDHRPGRACGDCHPVPVVRPGGEG